MKFPALPPYSIEPADDDLWSSGRRLSGEDAIPSTPNVYEVRELILRALYELGPAGVPSKAALAERAGFSVERVHNALYHAGILYRHKRFVHPAFTPEPWPFRPQRVFTW